MGATLWVALFFGALYLIWALLLPSSAGAIGRWVATVLFTTLGGAAYLTAPLILYGLFLYFKTQKASGYLGWAVGSLSLLSASAALLAALGAALSRPQWGGAVGGKLYSWAEASIGVSGAWLAAAAFGALGLQLLFEISWSYLAKSAWQWLREDWRDWRNAKRELAQQLRSAAEQRAAAAELPRLAPPPEPTATKPEPTRVPELIEPASSPRGEKPPRASRPGTAASSFTLPSVQLLKGKRADAQGGRPSEAEILSAVSNLEATLANFQIQARVSGYSPGPVITRYEVSPAPGVTVSSIVARSNDIALAMKARGIRMIAPIPGKAAIGIEIPNQRPASVTLREVLESDALSPYASPLAFGLGLSSDGTPLAADLQAMPHLLVAGATNSGKSVMVHSLIGSILLRARPDEVKFLLIDPKRIELSFYEGIPHLYDPKTPCEQVGVITHSKEAARSLKALVTVMEKRYEKFQNYRVRDIEGYNREALKRSEPTEFYIVVVIDELADLMVIARDVVEDSIQRLAQMARAVGIHLVLATQRPSVDVITGVIKANLPSRIALRVASKIDSKVILDINGAESLLGKGDLLYMIPGQEPIRVQGAFVSAEEIARVVDHLRAQGKPEYAPLETMSAVGEADLSDFGVEPLEFTQALKLVLERRRVSQDLLKSQFGSSARATNLLSLLEVKGFIHKPEGSNRWEIHFDQIEDHLRTHYPQVRLDKPGI